MEQKQLHKDTLKYSLYNYDHRVTFTDEENRHLKAAAQEIYEFSIEESKILEILTNRKKQAEWATVEEEYKEKLSVIDEIEKLAAEIQMAAEDRFMKETYRDNVKSVIEDAKENIDSDFEKCSPNDLVWVALEDTTKGRIIETVEHYQSISRMYINYKSDEVSKDITRYAINKACLFFKVPENTLDELLAKWKLSLPIIPKPVAFETTRHGPMLGTLSALSTKRPNDYNYDSVYKESIFNRDGLSLYADGFINGGDILGTPVLQFIDMLIIEYTANGCRDQTIEFSVSKYMEKRGIKNIEKARKQILDVLRKTYSFSLEYDGKSNKNSIYNMRKTRLITGVDEFKNGNVMVKLNDTFCEALKECPIMKYPSELFTLIETKNPNSYYLLKKITWHKHLNFNHANDDIISVKKLLESCPNLARYEEIVKVGRIKQRIIKPFERDMNAFSNTLTWEYFKDGKPLAKEEYDQLDYQIFISLMIHITWINHPSQREKLG